MKMLFGEMRSVANSYIPSLEHNGAYLAQLKRALNAALDNPKLQMDDGSKVLIQKIKEKYTMVLDHLILDTDYLIQTLKAYPIKGTQFAIPENEIVDTSKLAYYQHQKRNAQNALSAQTKEGCHIGSSLANDYRRTIQMCDLKIKYINSVISFENLFAPYFNQAIGDAQGIYNILAKYGVISLNLANPNYSNTNNGVSSPNAAGFAGAVGGATYGAYTGANTNRPSTDTNGSINPGDTVITPGEGETITPPPPEERTGEKFYAEYTAKAGDTFETISKKYYGDEANAEFIAEYNGMKVGDEIEPGRIIKVPWSNDIPGPVQPENGGNTEPGIPVTPPEDGNDEPVIPPAENEIIFGEPITNASGATPNQTIIPPIQQPDVGTINTIPTENSEAKVVPPTNNEISF